MINETFNTYCPLSNPQPLNTLNNILTVGEYGRQQTTMSAIIPTYYQRFQKMHSGRNILVHAEEGLRCKQHNHHLLEPWQNGALLHAPPWTSYIKPSLALYAITTPAAMLSSRTEVSLNNLSNACRRIVTLSPLRANRLRFTPRKINQTTTNKQTTTIKHLPFSPMSSMDSGKKKRNKKSMRRTI